VNKTLHGIPHTKNIRKVLVLIGPILRASGAISQKILQIHTFLTSSLCQNSPSLLGDKRENVFSEQLQQKLEELWIVRTARITLAS